jgi:pimeloyl-ACP methyl ester carboxylesterase
MTEIRSDIEAWVDFAAQGGFSSVIIQGHSAGAVAVANTFLSLEVGPELVGAVFASPTDMVGLQIATHGLGGFNTLLTLARRRIEAGNALELMPAGALPGYLFDAPVYLDLFEPDGPCDIFDFRCPERLQRLRRIGRPVLALFGDGPEVCSVPVQDALAHIKDNIAPQASVTCRLIAGASHSYRGHEDDFAVSVLEWFKAI